MRRIVGDDPFDADLLLPADAAATSTTSARSVPAPTSARSPTSPAAASPETSRACSRRASARSSTRRRGSGRAVFALARRARRARGRAPPRLQHRHRLLRRRPGRPTSRPATSSSGGSRRASTASRGATHDRRARQRRGDEPAGADRRGPADRRRRVEPRRRPRARARRGGRHPDRRLRGRRTTRPARRATRRWRDWLRERGVELVVLAGYMHLLRPRFFEVFGAGSSTRTRRRCPPSPGAHPIEDVLAAGVAETAATVHWVDEGDRHRPGDPRRAGARRAGRHARDACAPASSAVEHRILPEVVKELIAA